MITIKRLIVAALICAFGFGIYYAGIRLPFISGYGAKNLCSCVFVGKRTVDDVLKHELSFFPVSIGSYHIDLSDSSASASVFGLANHKAIYRRGVGCTLLSEISETDVRRQKLTLATESVERDTAAWPMGNRLPSTLPGNIDLTRLNEVVAEAFTEPDQPKLRNIRAVVVLYEGQIVAERYAIGFTMQSRHHGWSMTKSVTNALVGILVGDKLLAVDDPAPVAEWRNDDRREITLNNLLQATSGLRWKEDYGNPSEATTMLFKKKDMGGFAASAPLAEKPGAEFLYSSGTPNLISRIIREKLGDQEYYKFPYHRLFHKIGMNSAVMEIDASGTFVASSYSFATARDWARFGLLYLNDGVWNGERILPEGWVDYTRTPAEAAVLGDYGALFRLNAGTRDNSSHRRYPTAPSDVFSADGYEGQNIWIIPSKKLVIVRLSQEHGSVFDENKFVTEIAGTVKEPVNFP